VSVSRDRTLLYAATLLRAIATGLIGVLAGLYLARLSLSSGQIGAVLSAGLAGATVALAAVTLLGDRAGRRRVLTGIAVLAAAGGLAVALASDAITISIAAFLGMLNAQGRDRGAMLVIENALLPSLVADRERTRGFAWYNVLQDAGHAAGAGLAAVPQLLRSRLEIGELTSLRGAVVAYAVLIALSALLYSRLSRRVEAPEESARRPLTPHSRRVVTRISALFAIDSVAGGFLGSALMAYFFAERFGASQAAIAALFVGGRILSALSHLGAAWLAGRFGLVNTMVFTHIPSSLLLMTIPFAPSFQVAAVFFLLREGLVEMDVPTRQSYVMAVVRPEERTRAGGVTHLVRLAGWAVAPVLAGGAMQTIALSTPLFIAGAMKIAYDLLLWRAFHNLKPPEEA
jgi:MFS family permease